MGGCDATAAEEVAGTCHQHEWQQARQTPWRPRDTFETIGRNNGTLGF